MSFRKDEEAIAKYFHFLMKKLKIGMVIAITGSPLFKTGAGKSWTALKLASIIDPDFSIDKVVYHPEDFLKVLERVEKSGKPGQVVVIDEGGIMASSGSYHDYMNKAVSYTLQTFRTLNCMAIFCMPNLKNVDKRVRELLSHWGYCEKTWDSQNKRSIVRLKMYRLKQNLFKRYGDDYRYEKIQMYSKTRRRVVTFDYFDVEPLDPELAEQYEEFSKKEKSDFRKMMLQTIEKMNKKLDPENATAVKELCFKIHDNKRLFESCMNATGSGLDPYMIRHEFPEVTQKDAIIIKNIFNKTYYEQIQERKKNIKEGKN